MQACMQELLDTVEICDCGFTSHFLPTPHFKSFFIKQMLSPHEYGQHINLYIDNNSFVRRWYAFSIAIFYEQSNNTWSCDEITTNFRNCRENMINLSGNYLN